MRYLSTRDGRAIPATYAFEDVLLAGLAEDGGLYVPEQLSALNPAELRALGGPSYAELAARVMALFAGEAALPDLFLNSGGDVWEPAVDGFG